MHARILLADLSSNRGRKGGTMDALQTLPVCLAATADQTASEGVKEKQKREITSHTDRPKRTRRKPHTDRTTTTSSNHRQRTWISE